MAGENLTEAQRIFLRKHLKMSLFSKSHDKKVTRAYESYLVVEDQFNTARNGLPNTDPRVKTILASAKVPFKKRDEGKFAEAEGALSPLVTQMTDLRQTIETEKSDLLRDLGRLTDPPGLSPEKTKAFNDLRTTARQAVTATHPGPEKFKAAREAVEALRRQIATITNIAALDPTVATKTNEALARFERLAGTDEVTPERVSQTRQARNQAEADSAKASDDLRKARALPANTPEEQRLRDEAVRQAEEADRLAQARLNDATAMYKAVAGKKFLTDAVTSGPLAPDAPRPLSPRGAQSIIQALETEPQTAQAGIDLLARSKDPEALAGSTLYMCGRVEARFPGGRRSFSDQSFSRNYGASLLRQGDAIGGDYFTDLDRYLKQGKQFEPSKIGKGTDNNGKALPERDLTSMRSEALARSMLGTDGKLKTDLSEMEAVYLQLNFSPEAVLRPTPTLTQHATDTIKQLFAPSVRGQTETVVNGATRPKKKPATDIVRGSLGKQPGDKISDSDTRIAILKGMFTPVDQGPVGSCFTTAPTRRFREERPLDALRGMTEVATTGKFTSATGVKVPVPKNIPQGENPVMRGWEYSIASAAGTTAGSRERTQFANNLKDNPALDRVANLMGEGSKKKTRKVQNTIQTEMQSAFSFQYNATKPVSDANDGSSSTGAYQIHETDKYGAPTGSPIETPDQFIAVTTQRILKKLKVDPMSPRGIEIAEAIRDDMFVELKPKDVNQPNYKALSSSGYQPWNLKSGGLGLDPTKALYGDSVQTTQTLTPSTNPPPTEGERSKAVLLNVLTEAEKEPTKKYQTIDSRGCHEYNALPQDPSLKALLGTPNGKTTAQKVDDFVRESRDRADQEMSLDRALKIYDKAAKLYLTSSLDPAEAQKITDAIANNRPTAPVKPAELSRRIALVQDMALDLHATADGGTDKEIAQRKTAYKQSAKSDVLDELAIEIGMKQVVWADTNWGNGSNHIYFVMMGDPTTGELCMWQRTDPPGKLDKLDRKDWVDKGMHITK